MMRAARIENGIVADLWEVPSLDCYGDLYTLVEAPKWVQLGATWDGATFVNPPPPPKTPEEIIAEITAKVQARLDAFARTRDYDGILSACTYATSTVPKFAAEGQYCVNARDNTWATLYQLLAKVQAGTRPMPSGYEDIEPLLPVLEWPE